MSDFSSEFIEEAREKLECFRNVILEVEQSGVNANLMNEAFRAVHTIKGSGAMVGFSHLAASIHILETELDIHRKGETKNLSQEEIDRFLRWSDFIETYLNGLARDRSYTLNPGDLLGSPEVLKPVEMQEVPAETAGDKVRVTSQIYPIQYRSYLVSSRAVSEEISWSLLALSALGLPDAEPENFADTALDILRTQCNLTDVTRICFVRRIGLSNQYESLSAASVHKKLMQRGTRCFVHPESSLSKIGPGYLRVLDISQAMESYKTSGRRPQRVVKTLAEAGFKSGLCLGVGTRRHNLGYLFVNEESDSLLNLRRQTLPLISELAKYAARHLRELPCPEPLYYQLFQENNALMNGRRLLPERIEDAYNQVALVLGSAPLAFKKPSSPLPPALISHANIGYMMAKIASMRGVRSCELTVFADSRRIVFNCRFVSDQPQFHSEYLAASKVVAHSLGFVMDHPSLDTMQFSVPFDPCLDQYTKYSA